MRVTVEELADFMAIGQLRPNDTVTIVVYDITNGSTPVLDDDSCTEYPAANTTGMFYWSFSNLNSQPAAGTVRQYLWIMTNLGGSTYSGTVMVGGVHDETLANQGTPVALDGGAATLAGMLIKMADDNGGADFDATRDSQNAIAVAGLGVKGQTDKLIFDGSDNVAANVVAMEDGVIVAAKIGLGAITADKIAADAITADKIADDAIGADQIGASAIVAATFGAGAIDAAAIKDGAIDAATFAAGAITAAAIAADAITADKIADDALEPGMFSDPVPSDVVEISGDATAADNLEAQFDTTGLTGDTFPARQDQLDNLAIVGSAVKTVAESFTLATGSEVSGTYASTHQYDGTVHQLADTAGTLDGYYQFDIGAQGIPVDVTLFAAVTGLNDYVDIYGYIWGTTSWAKMGTISGKSSSSPTENQFTLLSSMVGTGANLGKVRVRVYGTGLTTANFYNDFMTVSYSINRQTVGYSDGAVWVKATGTSGTTPYINGVADNPCPWADAVVIAAALGLSRFRVVSGESVTLGADSSERVIMGKNWDLDLNGQVLTDAFVDGARVTGTGTSAGSAVIMEHCGLGAVSLPACRLYQCGIGRGSGAFSASQAGQFNLIDCFSLVPGAGTPSLDFSGNGPSTGINIRRWSGGSNITLDSDCILSLEVVTGGGQTIDLGGGAAEIRGICRSLTLTLEIGAVAQFAGVTGPVTINGTGGTVRLYGVHGEITDNSAGAVTIVTDGVSLDNINAEALLARFQQSPAG